MFNALKNRQFPNENMHDVYCSECGKLTKARSRNNAEGGAETIQAAGVCNARVFSANTVVDSKLTPRSASHDDLWGY